VNTRIGDLAKPVTELEVEIIEIAERAAHEEVFTDVAEWPIDLAFGFGSIGAAGFWQKAIMASELAERPGDCQEFRVRRGG
jgi:hypothetical protein